MRVSVRVRYAAPAALEPLLVAAEDFGYDGFWISEPWGVDAFAVLGWCAARTRRIPLGTHVASVFARTPAATAAAAATVASLSGGRFRLGLGTSGPNVVEGWHGVPFDAPVERTRDTIAVLRAVLSGEKVAHDGATVSVPLGERRALRTALADEVPPVPVYLGALGPRNQRLTADVADGWTPTPYSPDFDAGSAGPLRERLAGNGRTVAVAPTCPVAIGADLSALWELERGWSALYLGGMGEFYATAARAMGQDAMVERIRERWAAGDRRAAKAAVGDDYADAIGLFGSATRIGERAARYVAAGVDELVLELRKPDLEDQLADLRAVREALS
ncbi:MAG TPA: LLM class flavin-dependent oxidoreductase [Sporichthyaceae bacterium]|jgi:F420-dependent oxidoreductase-like protein